VIQFIPIIIKRTVVSKPDAAIKVVELTLSQGAKRGLTTGAKSLPPVTPRSATPLLFLALMLGGIGWILFLAAMLWVFVSLTGCSATKQIGNAAREVQARAASASGHLESAVATGDVGKKAMPHVEAAKQDVDSIGASATEIAEVVASGAIKDSNPLWWIPFAIIGGVLLYFHAPIRAGLSWLGARINIMSKSTKAQAAADAAWEADTTPVDNTDVPLVKAMAIREATDPAYRVAKAKASKEAK
jgi:hypothetical protein